MMIVFMDSLKGEDMKVKHGMCGTRIYRIWKNMRTRVNNTNFKQYNDYGGKGVVICDEWNDFSMFHLWAISNGYSDDLTLDRIDVDCGYSPSNCRWVGYSTQATNTRRIRSSNTSGYRGVSFHKRIQKWIARIQYNKKMHNLGYFNSASDAAREYDKFILDNLTEHPTNFIYT